MPENGGRIGAVNTMKDNPPFAVTDTYGKRMNEQEEGDKPGHFGSGENYSLTKVINFINNNYKDKKIIAGKGYTPWSNDSIIRGPMTSSKEINFYKPKTKTSPCCWWW